MLISMVLHWLLQIFKQLSARMQKKELKRIEQESNKNRKRAPSEGAPGTRRAPLGPRKYTRAPPPRPKTGEHAANEVASAPSRPLPPPEPSNTLSPRVFVQEGVAERASPRGRRQHRGGDSGGMVNHEYGVVRGAHGPIIMEIIVVHSLSVGFTSPVGHGTSSTASTLRVLRRSSET